MYISVCKEKNSIFKGQKGIRSRKMNKLRPYKKEKYHRKSTRDLSNLKPVVNPELKKSSDELIKVLVNNLNKNTV